MPNNGKKAKERKKERNKIQHWEHILDHTEFQVIRWLILLICKAIFFRKYVVKCHISCLEGRKKSN